MNERLRTWLSVTLAALLLTLAVGPTFAQYFTQAFVGDGSCLAPGYSFTNNTNRGVANDTANTGVQVCVGGATVARFLAAASGQILFGQLRSQGPLPTLTACGTAPTVSGTDTAGIITIGTGTPSACTITFANAAAQAPACFAVDQVTATANPPRGVATTTTFPITFAAATVNGDTVAYFCMGKA